MIRPVPALPHHALERRYRRLLLAYPARFRRRRGVEMLTTLMDAAPADRDRPTLRDTVDVVLGGIRCRLSRRGAPLVMALLAAMFGAMLGGIGFAYAGWQTARDLPGDADAAAIARTALPNAPAEPDTRIDALFDYEQYAMKGTQADISPSEDEAVLVALLGGDDYGPGFVRFTTEHPGDSLATLRAARTRLHAEGWRVGEVTPAPYGGELAAYRDGLVVMLLVEGDAPETTQSVYIERSRPPIVAVLTVLGLILGGLVGWVLTGWATSRLGTAWRKAAAWLCFTAGSMLLLAPAAWNLAVLAASVVSPDPLPVWVGYIFILTAGPAKAGTLLLLIALLVAATAHGVRDQEPTAATR